MAGLIAMTSVLIVVGIEMFFATRGAGHMHGSEYDTVPSEQEHTARKHPSNGHIRLSAPTSRPFKQTKLAVNGRQGSMALGLAEGSSEHLVLSEISPSVWDDAAQSPDTAKPNNSNDEASGDESDLELDELDPTADASSLLHATTQRHHQPRHRSHSHPPASSNPSQTALSTHQVQQKLLLQCLLLEAGILFHSVFIGMALSVATGTSFLVLLVAISFHQTFEGLALGSRIAAITSFPPASPKPWLMALAYGTTTPAGQAVGLAVHNLYDPAGRTGLLMVGVMNAVSSGLLLFAGLVELLAEDFLSDKSYETLTGRRRMEACGAVVGGSLLMALVGAWA